MQTTTFEGISKTRAIKARRYLYNRGIVSKYDREEKTFTVYVTKHGVGSTRCVAITALELEHRA